MTKSPGSSGWPFFQRAQRTWRHCEEAGKATPSKTHREISPVSQKSPAVIFVGFMPVEHDAAVDETMHLQPVSKEEFLNMSM